MKELKVTCQVCRKVFTLKVVEADFQRWQKGALIQNVMPYLSDSGRELLISGSCGSCFDEMFK